MFPRQLLSAWAARYREYPPAFWTLVGITFVDRLGGALLFPFFALYLTARFQVGMSDVGLIFAAFSLSAFGGSLLGGALTDRLGRKGVIIFSLVATSISGVLMGLADSFQAFLFLAAWIGLLTDAAGPAHQAIVADLLPEAKRAEGFGLLRVGFNLAVTIGPAIGGFLAARSYLLLFAADAVISLLAAGLVWAYLPETKPAPHPEAAPETLAGAFRGYGVVLRDRFFMLFVGACLLMGLVYMNMNTSLGVYLRDTHGVPEAGYGFILSLNAALVVLFQFWTTRQIEHRPPLVMMALGTAGYALGFALYGAVTGYGLFLLAMVIITIGEMIVSPVSLAVIAGLAPEQMRGRYMAIFGFSWVVPFAVGPYLAGLILDHLDPRWLWYAAGLVGLAAAASFLGLHAGKRAAPASSP